MAKMITTFNSVVTAFSFSLLVATTAIAQTDELDRLFDELSEAAPESAGRIEGQIQAAWERSGSAAMDLLLRRGQDALEGGEPDVAAEHFTALVDHADKFAEGYNGRATAYYLMGMIGPALDDIRTTLRLNPRHYGAMRGLAIILEDIGRPAEALEVYYQVKAINPHAEGVAGAIARLEIELEGQSL